MIQKLTSIAALIGVVSAIGAGFVQYGKIMAKIEELDARETVINETVDLAPINEKISNLEVEILDRMSALEDEWMARDNDTNDVILDDIAGLKANMEKLFDKASNANQKLQLNIVELSDKTFKEFGKIHKENTDQRQVGLADIWCQTSYRGQKHNLHNHGRHPI